MAMWWHRSILSGARSRALRMISAGAQSAPSSRLAKGEWQIPVTRPLTLFVAAALTAYSSQAGDYSATQRNMLIAAAKRQQQRDAAVIKQMPVDYRDCVLPVLLEVMRQDAKSGNHLYVAVFGHDMDAHLQAALARHGITAYPSSAMPKWGVQWGFSPSGHPSHGVVDPQFTPYWGFSIGDIVATSPGRYTIRAGYTCGSLCGGRYRFNLKVDGKLCIVTSRRPLGAY
jgi:hypothetical protein